MCKHQWKDNKCTRCGLEREVNLVAVYLAVMLVVLTAITIYAALQETPSPVK